MILNYKSQRQILHYWCWAAVSSSVSFFYNGNARGISQAAIVSDLIDERCGTIDPANPGAAPRECNVPMDISESLKFTRNYAGEVSDPLEFDDIVQQINSHFPICCQILWDGFDQSHFVAIYGYESTNLIVADPELPKIVTVSYDEFLNYRGGTWRRTIGTQHP